MAGKEGKLPRKPPKLTARQERFVGEYLKDLKAGPAAVRAGYSPRTAETCGPRLLRFAQVAEAIAKGKEERATRMGITSARVLAELELLAFSDHANYGVDDRGTVELVNDAPDGANRAVSAIKHRIETRDDGTVTRTVEIKLWDKPGMLKLAGRHVGLFPDKLQLTGKDGAPLVPGSMVTVYMPSNGRENESPEDEIPEPVPSKADGSEN